MVGRETERVALQSVLDAARTGTGGALVLSGEPGAGKSVLLADAVATATDMKVLRVRGVESESPLPFAALHRALRPLMGAVPALPRRQCTALRAALGLGDTPDDAAIDRFVVYLAALTLLSEASSSTPLVLVVDDAHWLDDASREALLFVARRVDGEHLAVLLAVRDSEPFDGSDLPMTVVRGLDLQGARELLTEVAGADVPGEVVQRLHDRTTGNPLALAELGAALGADVLLGRQPLPAQLPLTGGVEAAFLDRYRRLAPAARTVVLVAAADDSGDFATVLEASRALGADDAAVDTVERSGLLRRIGPRVELRHPLVRSAVYAGATTPERRRAHAALADALHSPQDADRRAWHRAAAADRPDDAVVGELEAAALRSTAVGAHEAAAAAWERAAELTEAAEDRGLRLYRAAAASWEAGQPDRAAALADAALLSLEDPQERADAVLLRARVEWNTGSVQVAHRQLLRQAALVSPHAPSTAREMAMFAASLAATTLVEPGPDPRAFVGEPRTERDRCVAHVLEAFVSIARHDWGPATAAVRAAEPHSSGAVTDVVGGVDPVQANLALAALHVADDDIALRLHERLLAEARAAGAPLMVLYALTRRGAVDTVLGRWDHLATGAHEALTLAEATGRTALTAMPLAWLALVAAMRGDDDASTRLAALEAVIAAGPGGTTEASVRDQLLWTRALLADSPVGAIHHYEQMTHGFAERMVALDRIETAAVAGRRDLATRWLEAIDHFARGTGSAWAAAIAEHGRGVLTEGPGAGAHLASALELHQHSARRVDAARSHLAYGEWLRRQRRRVDARTHLRAALQTFEDVGARRWAERARQELRASGETARRHAPDATSGAPSLTPTELQVARLVAQGRPTRDVAGQMFVSPRTVDFHLRNVFAKLGVTSRAELAHADLG